MPEEYLPKEFGEHLFYTRIYNSHSGGNVTIHYSHNGPERIDNETIARFLADDVGETVKLLPIGSQTGIKNPDAEIGGVKWEFKTNRVGSANSVDNEIRRAHRQADCILLWLVVPMDIAQLENTIYNRVRQCISLQKCRFILGNALYEFSRSEIVEQTFRGKLAYKGEGGLT